MLSVVYAESHTKAPYAERHYAECRYAECRGAFMRCYTTSVLHYYITALL
jgi:hypothetical protein